MAPKVGPIRKLWYTWKMKPFPWRKQWLVGFDLEGNTFWEFKDQLVAGRMRRIAKYPRSTYHSDVNVSPQWLQWLRHTRLDPPSVAEQQNDVIRLAQIKVLAAQADARWAAKPSAMDAPEPQQPAPMLETRGQEQETRGEATSDEAQQKPLDQTEPERKAPAEEPKDSPWKQAQRGNPGDEWQPKGWTPGPAKRRL